MKIFNNKVFEYEIYSDGSGSLYVRDCCGCGDNYFTYIIEDGSHKHKIGYLKADIKLKLKDINKLQKRLKSYKKSKLKIYQALMRKN